jgi:AcrR family transcriptional regulator
VTERRPRTNPRGDATRVALIETAETLFGKFGIESVSTRQIGATIGSSNTNIVAYYFGTKDALVEEVIRYRGPGIEQRRAEIFGLAHKQESLSLIDLLDSLYRPLFEQTNDAGEHSYAAFLASLLRANRSDIRFNLAGDYPVSTEIGELLKKALPSRRGQAKIDRLFIVSDMIFSALRLIDHLNSSPDEAKEIFSDTLNMMQAALAFEAT